MQEMAATACMSSYSLARLLPLSRFGNQHIFKLAEASMLLGLPIHTITIVAHSRTEPISVNNGSFQPLVCRVDSNTCTAAHGRWQNNLSRYLCERC